ncbi:MAG: zinc-ribbon and DUF3426 domain-containing protein [Woeseiaceae bacterium]
MYTQCPDCNVAFRVTADVLKQAAGKVRCGGCGNAFNALDFLSEDRPAPRARQNVEAPLPELKPDPPANGGELPVSISAEQSAALLKTLDELAGSDIRIEDTGVEWRVLDDDEVGEAADDAIAIDVDIEDQPQIDEILDESPTPVDQFLTDTPPEIDAPEIFEESAAEPAQAPVEELRFDDNTPLPEDFDFADDPRAAPAAAQEPEPEPEPVVEETPEVDLDLSEPDEWTDILDEFEGIAEELSEPALADEDPFPVRVDGQEDDVSADDTSAPLDDDDLGLLEEGVVDPVDKEHAELDELDDEQEETTEPEEAPRFDLIDEGDDGASESGEDRDEDDGLSFAGDGDESPADDGDDAEPPLEHYVPPPTEEEQTINLQIDQDLLAIAVEDDDGLASTIVIPEDAAAESLVESPELSDDAPAPTSEASGEGDDDDGDSYAFEFPLPDSDEGFETIIMEGEFVRSELDQQKLAADAAAAASLAGAAAAEREAEENARKSKVNYKLVAGIVVLALLLVGQYLHQSRESLATIPAFNSVVGPVYRAIGQPLSPAWNVAGWRFEATRGSTDDEGNDLTIYSRIGNNSDKPLPYPLIAISLTDRFEETIGSRILDPADYLANDLDPRDLVEPGANFNAAITIQSPTDQATGFKLNVCYRESGGDLRCAIDDFK